MPIHVHINVPLPQNPTYLNKALIVGPYVCREQSYMYSHQLQDPKYRVSTLQLSEIKVAVNH